MLYMIGCFNISLYSYFDIHRIFDLILFSIWDFILWWFDLDFVLFDFNFDIILCLSFLLTFMLHFFMNLLFSFLTNFININNLIVIHLNSFVLCLYTGILNFLSFFFISGIHSISMAMEIYVMIHTFISVDFVGFSDFSNIYFINNSTLTRFTNMFILFYFTIIIVHFAWFMLLRFFFSNSYIAHVNVDKHVTNNLININTINLIDIILLDTNYVIDSISNNIYYFVNNIKINIIFLFSILHIFNAYTSMTFNNTYSYFYLIGYKIVNYLYPLNVCYSLNFYSNQFSDINIVTILMYTIFIINFFGNFTNDFTYITLSLNLFTLLFTYNIYINNMNIGILNLYNNQLLYMTYC